MGIRRQCYDNLLAQQTWDFELSLYVITRGGRVPEGNLNILLFKTTFYHRIQHGNERCHHVHIVRLSITVKIRQETVVVPREI